MPGIASVHSVSADEVAVINFSKEFWDVCGVVLSIAIESDDPFAFGIFEACIKSARLPIVAVEYKDSKVRFFRGEFGEDF